MLEKRRLEKQSLARARGISGHLDVIRVNVGFDRISNVFDLDVGKLSGAHPTLNVLTKRLLTLRWRVVVVPFFPFHTHVSVVLKSSLTFECTVLIESQFR